MHSSYEDFLRRLNQYRLYLNMTQEELSAALGITQSQFSKMELGKTIMSFEALDKLMGMGWDVDYLFTGKKFSRNVSKLDTVVMQVEEEDRKALLNMMAWLLKEGIEKCCSTIDKEIKCEIDILSMGPELEEDDSVMLRVRKISKMPQTQMAERLGVNIKNYRELEKKEKQPDAELLFHIYEITSCRPTLLFNYGHVEYVIIDDLWDRISSPVQDRIFSLIEQVLYYVRT